MMDDDNDNMDLFVFKITKLKYKSYTDVEAVKAIQLYIEAGEDIPKELYPLIDEACGVWLKSTGIARKVGLIENDAKWHKLVYYTRLLKRFHKELTVLDAAWIIARKYNEKGGTLKNRYGSGKYDSAIEEADFIYENSSWRYK